MLINEFVSSNGTTLADEDGDFSDWIELFNAGAEPVDLNGWGISDDLSHPFRWTLPERTLQPGEFLLVWASGKDRKEAATQPIDPNPDSTTPDEIPGLVLWLRPEALQDQLAQSAPILAWNDASGFGNHATATPAPFQAPTLSGPELNGFAVANFNGTDAQLSLPHTNFNGLDNLENFTFLSMARWDGKTTSGLVGTGPSNSNSGNLHFEIMPGGNLRLRISAMNSINLPGIAPGWTSFGARQATDDDEPVASLIIDGQVAAQRFEDTGSSQLAEYGGLFLGNSHNSPRNFEGAIAEVLIYNRPLNDNEIGALQGYFDSKYALNGEDITPHQPTQALHTNFAISSDGEPLILSRPDGSVADLIEPVEVPRDRSYGRSPDGGTELKFFMTPTPLASNSTPSFDAPLEAVEFSIPRGFYNAPFSLSLSHPDPAAIIYFTTDGSPPHPDTSSTYSAPLSIDATTTVRALAFKPSALPTTKVITHTYLFLDDIVLQPDDPVALGFPSQWGTWSAVHYGFEPEVSEDPQYASQLENALTSLPTLSIVMDMDDLFDPNDGIYASRSLPSGAPRGLQWERPASVEIIYPDGSKPNHQINAGIRIQGGASRRADRTPKSSFRLLFKNIYETGTLAFPLFDQAGTVDEFNSIILRAEYNNSWLHGFDASQRQRAQYLRDQFVRQSQILMSGYGSQSNHMHLYLNGVYWGVYNPSERPDAAFAASYFGGEREDWDAITHRGLRDGNASSWNTLNSLANQDLTNQANYQAVLEYLDLPNYIDYMIVNLWAGTNDWPFNNWNAARRRAPGEGFKFFCWDAERSMEGVNQNRINVNQDVAKIYASLRANPEFRLQFADRVHRHLFNEGVLTPASTIARYTQAASLIETALIAESARWGSFRRDKGTVNNTPEPQIFTVNNQWRNEHDDLLNNYLPNRTAVVLQQFKNAELYPELDAPAFNQHGGTLTVGETVALSAPTGQIFFTLDGSDPRESFTGNLGQSAALYQSAIELDEITTIKARTRHNGEWSALLEATFSPLNATAELIPANSTDWDEDANWTTQRYPNGVGQRARIFAPSSGNRNINLNSPISVAAIHFDHADSPYRNRVRDRATGNWLTFDNGEQSAIISVNGTGQGFAEFEFAAECILSSNLELQINNPIGDPEHGALRLRTQWSGHGGLNKTGIGTASLTGSNKLFSGAVNISEGRLRITEPALPRQATDLSVANGAQLLLSSSGSLALPRIYDFPHPINLAGDGLSEIPASPELPARPAAQGALRFDPAAANARSTLTSPLIVTSPTTIHVAGGTNQLDLTGPITINSSSRLRKSGAGTLLLASDSPNFDAPLELAAGTIRIAGQLAAKLELANETQLIGHGEVDSIALASETSSAQLTLINGHLQASQLDGVDCHISFKTEGAPDLSDPSTTLNGCWSGLSANPGQINIYLDRPSFTPHSRFQGGFILPSNSDWQPLIDKIRVYIPAPIGSLSFDARRWVENTQVTITRVPLASSTAQQSPLLAKLPASSFEILEIRYNTNPLSFIDWQNQQFTPAELNNPSISGPNATPNGSGIPNLLHYALSPTSEEQLFALMPSIQASPITPKITFPYDPGKRDLRFQLESSDNLIDWPPAQILFDSATQDATQHQPSLQGLLTLPIPHNPSQTQFYRLKISQN